MATMKVIEIMSESTESWEDATESGVSDVCKSVNGVNSVLLGGRSGCSTFHRATDNILSFKKIVKYWV